MINVDFADVRTVMSEMGMAMMGTGEASGDGRAREATEKAIGSPLLEDVDLHGARGILVNVTAGPDLSIGEFSEVGDTIEEFASDKATVVVGTVIDPEIQDQLRVTVVATGIGGLPTAAAGPQGRPNVVVDNTQHGVPEDNNPDYAALDLPTVKRRNNGRVEPAAMAPRDDVDYLDIPAFLRRQAD